MAVVRLQFVLGSGLSSRLIAWYGNGYGGFSHVDAVLSDGLLGAREDCVGGQPPGVYIRPFDYESWHTKTVVALECTDQEAWLWEEALRMQIGQRYDKGSIVSFILGRQPDDGVGQWICSAAQNFGLRAMGKLPKLPVPDAQITPNSLFLMVCAIGGVPG